MTTDIYIILCKYLLYCDKDLIYLHYRHQNVIKNQHLHKDFIFFCLKVKKKNSDYYLKCQALWG